ncbi:L,D-transpeptidase family protein [Glacieibacterium frigidum]|uniref:L,D-transpeptidase family protein n=1 Tax=Glacieibacterium frigidum TaxID=2593303 RepID=A0A552U9C8_9SPHN|nr:L,D-transpeptidase family protein [Glacieibacterium frigidum]TRW14822.1 L,D-transpeptidase family protein [Glacieibacterium frigidum]
MIVDTDALTLSAFGEVWPCVIGRGGVVTAATKREGDGATPLGDWPLRIALLRPDRSLTPPRALPWRWIRPADGWSDDPADPAYNRPVVHPRRFSAEHLWRDDAVYDVVVVLGHNDAPPVPGLGSAIFLHATRPDRRPTEGCVAVDAPVLAALLPRLATGMTLTIR